MKKFNEDIMSRFDMYETIKRMDDLSKSPNNNDLLRYFLINDVNYSSWCQDIINTIHKFSDEMSDMYLNKRISLMKNDDNFEAQKIFLDQIIKYTLAIDVYKILTSYYSSEYNSNYTEREYIKQQIITTVDVLTDKDLHILLRDYLSPVLREIVDKYYKETIDMVLKNDESEDDSDIKK